jgi:uncharacterized LabA/DUF88 family protein
MMQRVIAYIDGFNLYFGLRARKWRKYYWLDVTTLAASLLKPGQTLAAVHYFTARIRADSQSAQDAKRQSIYLDALGTRANLTIHEGHYLKKTRTCRHCGASWQDYEEKMTDVNIATALLMDAFDDHFDTALIISGDSDLTTPVQRVRDRFPEKRLIVAFPPKRHSDQLRRTAHAAFTIGEQKLRHSLLPDDVRLPSGYVLHRPIRWR